MNIQDWIAIVLAAGAALYVGRTVRRTLAGRRGCGCSKGRPCSGGSPASAQRFRGVKRLPLVPLHQVGLPPEQVSDEGAVRPHEE